MTAHNADATFWDACVSFGQRMDPDGSAWPDDPKATVAKVDGVPA